MQVFQIIFRKEIFYNFASIMECIIKIILDEIDKGIRPKHREFLRKASFNEVVPIPNEKIVELIHQNFYIQYFRVL